jgi:hypothetical protein
VRSRLDAGGSCRKTSLHNALQVEKMLRIARNGTENRNKDEEELCSRPANDYPETTKGTPIA